MARVWKPAAFMKVLRVSVQIGSLDLPAKLVSHMLVCLVVGLSPCPLQTKLNFVSRYLLLNMVILSVRLNFHSQSYLIRIESISLWKIHEPMVSF